MKQLAIYRIAPGLMLAYAHAVFLGGCFQKQSAVPHNRNKNIVTITKVQKMKIATPVIVQGIMVAKCPVAGCWFMLNDKSGTIKVDLKATKQNVVDIPLNSEVTVRGRIAIDGSKKMIRAVSATF